MGGEIATAGGRFDAAQAVADAILYEGYLLYPYRRSSMKNQVRWQFGVLVPPAWARAHGLDDTSVAGSAESWWQQTECLLQAPIGASVHLRLRFLHLQRRQVEALGPEGTFRPAGRFAAGGRTELTFDEAVPHECDVTLPVSGLLDGEIRCEAGAAGGEDMEPLPDGSGRLAGRVRRRRLPVRALLAASAQACGPEPGVVRLRVRVENTGQDLDPGAGREQALAVSLLATHVLAAAGAGSFISLLDPPEWAAGLARSCANVHTYPVLAGLPGEREMIISSPVLLPDHPQVAPESPGDLHDAAEIDELLSLRTLTLTDAEKREARATDARAARILDRVDSMDPETMIRLHGVIRPAGTGTAPARPAQCREPVRIDGTPVGIGSRVRLRPRARGTDAQDMFLAGRTARVEDVLTDVDGTRQLAVTVDDDPGADLGRRYGRFRHFAPDEVEPLPDGDPRDGPGGVPAGCPIPPTSASRSYPGRPGDADPGRAQT